jgi:CHAD domain-containing protein
LLFKKSGAKRIAKASEASIQLLLSKIRGELKEVTHDETLHDIRKKLKDIKTISSLLKELPGGKKNAAAYARISALEDSVGKWHDDVSLAEEIGKYIANDKGTALKNKALTSVLLKLNARKELHKEQLVKQLYSSVGV